MDIKKKLMSFLSFIAACLIAVLPALLYFFLVRWGVQKAMMYSAGSFVFVIAVCALGGSAAWLTLKRPLKKSEPQKEAEEAEEKEDTVSYDTPEVSESIMEEYPELFRTCEKEEETGEGAPAYYEALRCAFELQKAQNTDTEEQEEEKREESLEDLLKKPERAQECIPDIYKDIPDTLPEWYTEREEEEYEEAEEVGDAEEDVPVKETFGIGETVRSKVAVCAVALIIAAVYSALSALSYTVYDEDGFTVSTLGREKEYSWEDCAAYEISPSFFGDRLSITLYMKDGRRAELLPGDLSFREEFFREYKTVYVYALMADEKLKAAGAEKTVRERNTIESEFESQEEIYDQIMKLID